MVNLLRLIFAALLSLLLGSANAAVPPVTKYYGSGYQNYGLFDSKGGACSGVASRFSMTRSDGTPESCSGGMSGDRCYVGCGQQYWGELTIASTSVCPANSEYIGGQCVCKPGFTEKDGACVAPEQCVLPLVEINGKCSCPAGKIEVVDKDGLRQCVYSDDHQCQTFYALGNTIGGRFTQEYRLTGKIPDGSKFCMPGQFDDENRGCVVLFEQSAAFGSGSDWVTEGKFDGKPGDNGLACTVGTGDTPAIPQPEKCPAGFTGTVNGVEVCVNKVPDSGVEPGSGETTVDDGTNTTTTRTNTNTTCENGRCTTTTTVTTTVTNNASGTSTSSSNTTTTTQSQSDFCKASPNAKLCGGSGLPNIDGGGSGGGGDGEEDPSSFTGACAGGFQCKGDAIQCAIAREQHIRACRLFDKESPESKLYEELKGKEGDQTKDLPGNETVSIGDKINTTDALGAGGAGLSDLSLTVWNQQVTLPLSMLNQYLAALGNVLLAVSFLLAFRIVARG